MGTVESLKNWCYAEICLSNTSLHAMTNSIFSPAKYFLLQLCNVPLFAHLEEMYVYRKVGGKNGSSFSRDVRPCEIVQFPLKLLPLWRLRSSVCLPWLLLERVSHGSWNLSPYHPQWLLRSNLKYPPRVTNLLRFFRNDVGVALPAKKSHLWPYGQWGWRICFTEVVDLLVVLEAQRWTQHCINIL